MVGRCEVRIDEEQYAINEYRFLTDKKVLGWFRDLTECHYYNIIGLWIIKLIIKYYYYDTRERIGGRNQLKHPHEKLLARQAIREFAAICK